MENCFWEYILSDPALKCLNPSVLTKETNLSKPECEDAATEVEHLEKLKSAYQCNAGWTTACQCPKRCTVTDYHIFVDPTDACNREFSEKKKAGMAFLAFSFPSKRVCLPAIFSFQRKMRK